MIEVLKEMVEALEYHIEQTRPISKTKEAIQAGKKAIAKLESQERNFCQRCGKRLGGIIHTCTPPMEQNT
jgi:hypothetical protein